MKKIALRRIQKKNRRQTEPQKSQRKDTRGRTTLAVEPHDCVAVVEATARAHGHTHGRACDRASMHGRQCGPARSCAVGSARFIVGF